MKILLSVLCLFISLQTYTQEINYGVSEPLATAVKKCDVNELTKFFDTRLKIELGALTDIYNNSNSKKIIKDFYEKTKPKSVTIIKITNFSNGNMCMHCTMITVKAKYKFNLYYSLINDKLYVQEVQAKVLEKFKN